MLKKNDYGYSYLTKVTGTAKTIDELYDDADYYLNMLLEIYQVFDRDHPEVFWLNSTCYSECSLMYYQTRYGLQYTLSVDFILQDNDIGYDIRKNEYLDPETIHNDIINRDIYIERILSAAEETCSTDQKKVIFFNKWLTENNEYNTYVSSGYDSYAPRSSWSSISALEGRSGGSGPVCEGYARAFKVLCDSAGIPCVLEDGDVKSFESDSTGLHMWNLVRLGNDWYGVDVTWNDPSLPVSKGPLSGFESTEYLLTGNNTLNSYSYPFFKSHLAENCFQKNGIHFTNGPGICEESSPIEVTVGKTTDAAVIRKVLYRTDENEFFFKAPKTGVYQISAGSSISDLSAVQVYDAHLDGVIISSENGTVFLNKDQICYFTAENSDYINADIVPEETEEFSVYLSRTAELTAPEGTDYQWYYRKSGTGSFITTSVTSETFVFTASNENKGDEIYCAYSDPSGERCSTRLFIPQIKQEGPSVTEQPADINAVSGSTAKFSVKAEGDDLKYTWYYKSAGTSVFRKSSETSDTYSIEASSSRNGFEVYCVVTDKYGNAVTSDHAVLKVTTPLAITSQPENITLQSGETAKFSVKAQGDGLKYSWYYKSAGSSVFKKSSTTSSTYSIEAASSRNGFEVYCVISDKSGDTVTSDKAVLTVNTPLAITSQPLSITAVSGETAKFSVKAQGDGLKYSWYYKSAGSSAFKKSSTTSGTYSIEATSSRNGFEVYCVITDKSGNSVTSDKAVLTVNTPLAITSQPENITASAGTNVKFTVKAQGDGLKYSWYYKSAGTSVFRKSSSVSGTYSIGAVSSRDGFEVYCVVTDKYGNTVTSDHAVLKVYSASL